MPQHYLQTGLRLCYDASGREIPCSGSGQDAEFEPGRSWPEPRFKLQGEIVLDRATDLYWTQSANPLSFPMSWAEALEAVNGLNGKAHLGRRDWRLPNRRELRSLIDHSARQPALPNGHPFEGVFSGWVWTSTTSAMSPAYAWRVHLEGGRMFYGAKADESLVWPVAGESSVLPATGQQQCFDANGSVMDCGILPGQDGHVRAGVEWPEPRFTQEGGAVRDNLTGLLWSPSADVADGPTDWDSALKLSRAQGPGFRLPTINELESLVDAAHHSPALPQGHPFGRVPEAVWSSTTSGFEPDWAFCLYFHKGAVGVGYKAKPEFAVWAVKAG